MKPIDPVKARKDLEEILSNNEYQDYYQQNQDNFLERVVDSIKEIIKSFFPEINISENTIEWISGGVIITGLLCLFLIVLLFWTKFSKEGMFKSKPSMTKQELNMPSNVYIREANALAEKGDYKEAFRRVFLALILELNQNGWIDAGIWKTNREYYYEIKDREAAKSFYFTAVQFEEVMYGGKVINMGDYLTYRNYVTSWINDNIFKNSNKLVNLIREN